MRTLRIAAVLVAAAAVAVAVVAIARPGNASATAAANESGRKAMSVQFSQLSRKTVDLQHTFIMAAYIGPIESPFDTVDLSGGIKPLTGRAALFAKLRPKVIPFQGMPTPFVIGAGATKGLLNAIGSASSGPAGTNFKVGIFAIQTTTGKTAVLKLGATAGKKMLTTLAGHLSGGPKVAMTRVKLAIFP